MAAELTDLAAAFPAGRLERWIRVEHRGQSTRAPNRERYREMIARDAIHEAGHAVAAWHLGFEVEFAQIRPGTGGLGGMVRWNGFGKGWFETEIVRYAGVAAEHPRFDLPEALEQIGVVRVSSDKWTLPAEEWGEAESVAADALHDLYSHSEHDRRDLPGFDVDMFCMAQGLLRSRWAEVERIARLLLERVTLRSADFAALLGNA